MFNINYNASLAEKHSVLNIEEILFSNITVHRDAGTFLSVYKYLSQ